MKLLTTIECEAWLQDRSPSLRALSRETGAPPFGAVFGTPSEPAHQIVLAHQLSLWFGGGESLLWMTDWPFFTEAEMEAFLEWRKLLAAPGWVIDFPGHLFPEGESGSFLFMSQLISFLFAFNWEGKLYHKRHPDIIWLADEIVDIRYWEESRDVDLRRRLETVFIDSGRRVE